MRHGRSLAAMLLALVLLSSAPITRGYAVTEPDAPSIVSIKKDANASVTLQISKSGYSWWNTRIYRAFGDSSEYELIYDDWLHSSFFEDDTATVPGVYHYYATKANTDTNGVTTESKPSQVRDAYVLDTVKNLKITYVRDPNTTTGKLANPDTLPKLTWSAVPNAEEYRVYRGLYADEDLQLVGTVTGTSFIDATYGLNAGTAYHYDVIPVYGTFAGNSGMPVVGTRLYGINFETAKNIQGKAVALSWIRYSNTVTGYEVYYATKKTTPKATAKPKLKVKRSLVRIEGLKKNKTYYFFVRAVKKLPNGKTVKGIWSKPIKIKIKK